MTNQKTIALDLDSVLADVMQIWIEEYNVIFKTSIKKEDICEWHIHNILPLSEKCVQDLFIHVWKNRWKDIPPTCEDISVVTNLLQKAGYRISCGSRRIASLRRGGRPPPTRYSPIALRRIRRHFCQCSRRIPL